MNNRPFFIFIFFITLSLTAMISSCDNGSEDPQNDFDRSDMLKNFADNLIVPAYQDLQLGVNNLQNEAITFTSNPSLNSLGSLQQSWESAYTGWQYANAYNFGPGGEEGLKKGLVEELGTFPVSVAKIEDAVSSGNYNLSDFNRDARGFLTVEYLIYVTDNNNDAIITSFQLPSRKQYLLDVVADIKARTDQVVAQWTTNYKNEFIDNDGTDVGSGTSQLYNEFVKSFETIKNFKVGLPLGKRPGQTQPEPAKVEAYYSSKSVKMFKAHFNAVEDIWNGRAKDGPDGIGFREYLEKVEGGPDLITATEAQLVAVHAALEAMTEPPRFSDQLVSNEPVVDALHTELQKITRFFKSDMSSVLGIAITYNSGDGD